MSDPVVFVGPLERVVHLRTLPGLGSLAPHQLAAVAQHARERHFAQGQSLQRAGRPAGAFYVVVDGGVRVERPGMPPRLAGPGDQIGFLEVLAQAEAALDAAADSPVLALEFAAAAHLDVCEEHFGVLQAHLRYLAGGNIRATRRLRDGVWLSGPGRPAATPPPRLNLVERILTLSRSNALSSGSVEALAELAEAASELRAPAGAALWQRGQEGRSFLLLASGSVELRARDGRRFRHEGSALALGLHEALLGAPRWNEARVVEDVVALELSGEAFLDALEAHFDLARDVLAVMARQLLELRRRPPAG
jgi:CRP-like cAMP-binding protein